jgi:radical SAM superfamily enzyme YgiQ (UPF0313 family)
LRALVIDLNNFSRYPTLPVGQLVAVLRSEGVEVEVLSPFARGVQGYPRLTRARPWGLIDSRLRYWSAVTPSRLVRGARARASRLLRPGNDEDLQTIVAYTRELLQRSIDVVLISAYTMYERIAAAIAEHCRNAGVPVIVGGSYFVVPEIIDRWRRMRGVEAVFSGEPETGLAGLIDDLAQGRDVTAHAGVSSAQRLSPAAPPLEDLDRLPFPDYADFPWERYPNRIVPVMTGRGCEWGRCRFCADVITSAGRTFRSRSLASVLDEIRFQTHRHQASLLVFLDLKLNSDVGFWRGLVRELPGVAPGVAWTASVHVDLRPDNGLSRADLVAAREAGLVRITTGLETASRKLLKRMAKGTSPERTQAFVRDAAAAGISVRLTTIIGYPGEEPGDVRETVEFLQRNAGFIERVMINRFSLMRGSEIDRRSLERPESVQGLERGSLDPLTGVVAHSDARWQSREHRKAVYRLLSAVHRINRKPLAASAREFEGVM